MEHSLFNKEPNTKIKQVNHQNDNTMRHILSSLIVCIALAFPIGEGGSAYAQKVVHDKQKEKQWRSMETGPWDFAPDWYYYFLHKKYSGAETY